MAGNIRADNNGDIFVEFDYNNIIVVDPNKTIDSNGKIQERLVDHENLVMYANLEADVVPRTKLAVGTSPQNIGDNPNVQQKTISVAKINFLRPTQGDFLINGEQTVVPFVQLPQKTTDKAYIYKVAMSRLDRVSQEYYGTPYFGWLILQANPQYGGLENNIIDGAILIIPFPLLPSLQDYKASLENYFYYYGR